MKILVIKEQHVRRKEDVESKINKEEATDYSLSAKKAQLVEMLRKLFRGKYSKTPSSLKNSLLPNHCIKFQHLQLYLYLTMY